MHAMIIGAAGMIGRKLASSLAAPRRLRDAPLDRLTLVDVVPCSAPSGDGRITIERCDAADPAVAARLLSWRPDVMFHVAATVMGQAEASVADGYRINFDVLRSLLEAARTGPAARPARFVYASSIGIYGPPLPDLIDDSQCPRPDSSYGTQKAMSELLLADYSRIGAVDGVGLRLPTLCVRPGAPTNGNSGFFSNILREPLLGCEAVLPVPLSVRHWFASPRTAVSFLLHAAAMDTTGLGSERTLTMPGLSATVADLIDGLRKEAGPAAASLVRHAPDTVMGAASGGLPKAFRATRAAALGFRLEEESADDLVRFYMEDDLAADFAVRHQTLRVAH